MIKTAYSILKYIIINNSPILWPIKLIYAIGYQVLSRASGTLLSKKLFNGKSIILFPKCAVSSMFVYSDIPDKKEILLLRKKANNKTIFLDIGANIGSYSILLVDKVKEVFAFEPHPESYRRLIMNFALNKLNHGNAVNKAISNQNGKVFFSDMQNNLTENKVVSDNKNSIKVEAIKIDDWCSQMKFNNDVNFLVKVDVEGHEKHVFEGGKKFFTSKMINGILFECFETQEIFSILKKYGYKIKKVSGNNYWAKKN